MTRFSVEIGPKGSVADYATLRTICLECERLGYHAIYLPDGIQWTDFECWTSLSHLATSTKTLRLGPAATFITYHHPTILAKTAATLDVLSGGRLEFRLGAGGSGTEIDQVRGGLDLPGRGVRVEMLGEGLRLVKRLWSEERVAFRGSFFATEDAVCDPKPIQRPRPPITVCADGRRMLRVAAEHADVWEASGGLGEYRRKTAVFRGCCEAVGRDVGGVEKALEVTVAIARSDEDAEAMVKNYRRGRMATWGYGYDPLENAIVGRPDRCAEAITGYLRAGVSAFTVFFIGLNRLEPLRLFAEHVVSVVGGPCRHRGVSSA